MSSGVAIVGVVLALLGGLFCYQGWKRREHHRLVIGTETTDIRNIDAEGTVELEGTVSSDGSKTFVAPITQDSETVLAAWQVEEWSEHGRSSSWNTLATGIYAEPFAIEDATGTVRVDIGDHVTGRNWLSVGGATTGAGVAIDGVACEFEEFPYLGVEAESQPPRHIREFVAGEPTLPEQSGSITNLVDIGNAHGDRRYHEASLGVGDETYVLGSVRADEGATRPLHPEDATVVSADAEPFVVSDQSETALAERLAHYRPRFFGGVAALVVGLGVAVAGAVGVV